MNGIPKMNVWTMLEAKDRSSFLGGHSIIRITGRSVHVNKPSRYSADRSVTAFAQTDKRGSWSEAPLDIIEDLN